MLVEVVEVVVVVVEVVVDGVFVEGGVIVVLDVLENVENVVGGPVKTPCQVEV